MSRKWTWIKVPEVGQQLLVDRHRRAERVVEHAQDLLSWLLIQPKAQYADSEIRATVEGLRTALDLFYDSGDLSSTAESSGIRRGDAAWQAWQEFLEKLRQQAGEVPDSQRAGSEERDSGIRSGEAGNP